MYLALANVYVTLILINPIHIIQLTSGVYHLFRGDWFNVAEPFNGHVATRTK